MFCCRAHEPNPSLENALNKWQMLWGVDVAVRICYVACARIVHVVFGGVMMRRRCIQVGWVCDVVVIVVWWRDRIAVRGV